jgi:dipeptidyl aminopeptidase/acylaminoacyl peptidase
MGRSLTVPASLAAATVTLVLVLAAWGDHKSSDARGVEKVDVQTAASAVAREQLAIAFVVVARDKSSSWIALAGPNGRVVGTVTARPPRGRRSFDFYPSWSRDGRRVAFTRRDNRGGKWRVAVFVAERGRRPREISALRGIDEPQWSPDGRNLAFDSSVECRTVKPYVLRFAIARADGRGIRQVAALPRPRTLVYLSNLEWSPDGTRLFYVVNWDQEDPTAPGSCRSLPTSSLYMVNADGTGRRLVADGIAWKAAWSPDGTQITYVACEDDICELRVATVSGSEGVQTVAKDPPGWMWGDLAWPSGAGEILHTGPRGLYATNAGTGTTRTVATWPRLGSASASDILGISRDGRRLAIGYDPSELWDNRPQTLYIVDVTTGSKKKLTLRSPTGRIDTFGAVTVFLG